jgi:predicted MPP superfamily phosphohydrolase
MKIKYGAIILLVLSIYLILNYYVGKRIFQGMSTILNVVQPVYWLVFWSVALTYIISKLFEKYLSAKLNNIFDLVGSYWIVCLLYSLIIFPLIDLILGINNKVHLTGRLGISNRWVYLIIILAVGGVIVSILIRGSINARKSYVDIVNIKRDDDLLQEDLNIVMVSDIHLGIRIGNNRVRKMIQEINELKPDLVIIAGDIVDTEIEPFINNNMAEEFSKIKAKYGTFATLGNHDLIKGNGDIITEELRKNGVIVLRDEAFLVNDSFYVIGRDDSVINRLGSTRDTLKNIIKDIDKSKFQIVIDHTPNSINESREVGVHLHFSGHTHRGQIAPCNLVTKKMFEIDHGHLQKENLSVIVSSGYGTWGPPVRIGSKSEIVQVKVTCGEVISPLTGK